MPWKECDRMSLRLEALTLAQDQQVNKSLLARRYGISRKTLYKWIGRFDQADPASLADRSRRPNHCPHQATAAIEQRVLGVRQKHPAWGPRKILAILARELDKSLLPSTSTIGRILRRHDQIDAKASDDAKAYQRFEHQAPNDLWQVDFKGDFALSGGGRCYPLTMLDDHSRYSLLLRACANQQARTVWPCFLEAFTRYGLPRRMLMDNGSPWGVSHSRECYTRLEVQLMCLDIAVTHGRPYHPQTQGKEERFHRTLKIELLQGRQLADNREAQQVFDPWRQMYNHYRPHEALGQATPASRYRPSPRNLPAGITPQQYHEHDVVRAISTVGQLRWQQRVYKLSDAFAGRRVALRPTQTDGVWEAFFGRFRIAVLDQRDGSARMVRGQ